jgi:hypothetical protein
MHRNLLSKLVTAGAALFLAAGTALACGGDTWTLKLPGTVQAGVVQGNRLYAVTSQGHLIAVDLTRQTVRDYGTFGLELTWQVAVAAPCYRSDIACVATRDKLHLIDLAGGKLVRCLHCGQTVRRFGFIDGRRLYVQGSNSFGIFDLDGKATACTAVTAPGGQALQVLAAAPDASGKRLYVLTVHPKAALGVIDLATGQFTEAAPAPAVGFGGRTQLLVVGDRVYMTDDHLSYGMLINHFGYVDLKTGKYQAIKVPAHAGARRPVPGPGGSVFLGLKDRVYRCDAAGKVTSLRADLPAAAELLAVWDSNAIAVVGGNRLMVAPLEIATARAK